MTQIRVNLSSRVNNASIRREKRNGRDVIVVPSAVAKFDTVLNGIFYPKQELEASYEGLDKIPAPLGHPRIGNAYVSAREPEAINQFWSGGWNTNPRIEGDRIMSEVVIDVETAKRHPDGERMLNAIDAGEPISTSTGLLLERDEVEGEDYQFVGRNFMWDHLAILLDEPPAIGPEDGVGLMVNGENTDTVVINSRLDVIDDDIENVSRMMFELVEQREDEKRKQSRWNEVKGKVVDFMKTLVQSTDEGAAGLAVNRNGEDDMSVTKEEFEAFKAEMLSAVNAKGKDEPVADDLKATVNEAVKEAVKPIQDQMTANAEAEKAKAKAEHEAAVNKVVEAEILEKEVAETMDTVALNALAEKFGKPGESFGVNGGFKGPKDPNALSTDLPGGE